MQPRLLSDLEWARLQDYADQFEAARKRSHVADWSPFLPPPGDLLRLPVLYELIAIDLEADWRSGQEKLLESYLDRFPEIGGAQHLPPPLILEEFRTRRINGAAPQLEEYLRRFPAQAGELQNIFEQLAPPTAGQCSQHTWPSGLPTAVPSLPKPVPQNVPFSGEYRLLERIGKGSFGEVWRGESPSGIPVAVKVLHRPAEDEAGRRELASLELVKRLRHPALLATLDFWTYGERLYIAMELADGTLRDRLRECRKKGETGIRAAQLLDWFRDAADGLDFLHYKRILHRDVKSENILLVHDRAKLADFGLARQQHQTMSSVSFAGTPLFMAPEVWSGAANERSDQYSLAFTYAELRLGRRPISGSDFCEVMKNTLDGEPNLEGLPGAEKQVLRRALAKYPDHRYASCRQFVSALEKIQHSRVGRAANLPDLISDPGTLTRLPSRTRKGGRALAVVLVALLAGAVGLGWPTNKQPHRESTGSSRVPIDGELYDGQVDVVLPSEARVPFRLIAPPAHTGVKPFYLMKTKVTNAVYDEFSSQTRFFGQIRRRLRVYSDPVDGPVFDIPVEAANTCATWLGGRLPTPEELDCAAGYYQWDQIGVGPVRTSAVAVNSQHPWPLSRPHGDSVGGIEYLFSNGREFTNRAYVKRGTREETREVPLRDAVDVNRDQVVLRGWGWQEPVALSYREMASAGYASTMTQGYREASQHTSFRVTIEIGKVGPAVRNPAEEIKGAP
jgi:serine/threonine protein kinase